MNQGPILGFTGSRYLPDRERTHEIKRFLFNRCRGADGFVTGACTGMDALVGRYCASQWPQSRHLVIIPADRKQVDEWWLEMPFVDVIQMLPGTDYRDRNQEIVNRSDWLIAFPIGPEDHPAQRRSGTWQTVRMARRDHDREPLILPL